MQADPFCCSPLSGLEGASGGGGSLPCCKGGFPKAAPPAWDPPNRVVAALLGPVYFGVKRPSKKVSAGDGLLGATSLQSFVTSRLSVGFRGFTVGSRQPDEDQLDHNYPFPRFLSWLVLCQPFLCPAPVKQKQMRVAWTRSCPPFSRLEVLALGLWPLGAHLSFMHRLL